MKVRFPALKSPAYKKLLKEKRAFFRWKKGAREPITFNTNALLDHLLEHLSGRDRDAIMARIILSQDHIDSGMLGKTKLSKGMVNKGVPKDTVSRFVGVMKDTETEWQAWIDPAVIMTAGQSAHFSSCYMNGHQYHGSALVWAASVNTIMFTRRDETFADRGWKSRLLFFVLQLTLDAAPMLVHGTSYGANSGAAAHLEKWLYRQLGYDYSKLDLTRGDHRNQKWMQILFPRDGYFDPLNKEGYTNAVWPRNLTSDVFFPSAFAMRQIFPRWDLNLRAIFHCEICGKIDTPSIFCENCGGICAHCRQSFPKTELFQLDDSQYCTACVELMYKCCAHCGKKIHKVHVRSVLTEEGNYAAWCLDCIQKNAKTCPDCGNHTEYLEMSTLGKSLCRICLDRISSNPRGEANG